MAKKTSVNRILSASAPEDKKGSVQKSCFIVLHNSRAKALWDWLILMAVFYVAITVPYSFSFMPHDHSTASGYFSIISNVVVEMLFIVDIILNFRTTYVDKSCGEVVYDTRHICIHYIKTWFFVDLVAALPFDLLYVINSPMASSVHMLKTVRLLWILQLIQKRNCYSQYTILVLAVLISLFALFAHWMACFWYIIGCSDLESNQTWNIGWLHELGKRLDTPYINSTVGGPTLLSSYIGALYFSLSSVATVGFGNICANTDAEKIFSICTMFISVLVHSLVCANVMALVHRMYEHRAFNGMRAREAMKFCRVHRLPKQLKQRLLEHFKMRPCVTERLDADKLLRNFPDWLRVDIAMHVHREMFQLPVFKEASDSCLRSLSLYMKTSFHFAGDYLICEDDVLHANYFVCTGSLEVFKDNTLLATLGTGDSFGFDLLGTDHVIRTGFDVKAQTCCDLQYLTVHGLKEVLRLYPEYANVYSSNINNSLTYNLHLAHQNEDTCILQDGSKGKLRPFSRRRQRWRRSGRPSMNWTKRWT